MTDLPTMADLNLLMEQENAELRASNVRMAHCLKALRATLATLPDWRDGVDLIDEALGDGGGKS